ncbi:hypothetical protein LTR78_008693 [Recurvomyces mirabilis]|uniref:Uncharacterized protein n=1 Tax=Recurvomyces mirabilis TaxID=574656 RepID=A0AAE0WGV4_9PEZI|nr:hypothetical protein LTR78_008693 [Recurvomyces mirabilis]KAK5159222.1 hypothetical protein LTS14_002364 [Recurvomyces mirabilis]
MEGSKTLTGPDEVLPSLEAIQRARSSLLETLPDDGLGADHVEAHLKREIVPGLNRPSQSSHYYGFVIGGATTAARTADHIAVEVDQNVHVHLPKETVATDVEDRATHMVCELLNLTPEHWPHRIFSTGATASNVLGLACGREHVIQKSASHASSQQSISVAEMGTHKAMMWAGISDVQILTTVPHSSLRKAASIVGLGRAAVIDVGRIDLPHRFDMAFLEDHLREEKTACIVAVSCAEVNTGLFATDGNDMARIRALCDKYGAWLHVDAAFGLLARILPPNDEYSVLNAGVAGLELADSITGDAHKLLNVVSLYKTFYNTNAAYLNTGSSETTASKDRTIPSPLNIGIENSRRFRALPVYATLAAYGKNGYRDMLERQIRLARGIAKWIMESSRYELLPPASTGTSRSDILKSIYIVVLFRARDGALNESLVQRINSSRRMYVSGTQWIGKPAARFAIATWLVDPERDLPLVITELDKATQ